MPPDILDFSTSTDMVVQEGINVTLKCAARGSPQPIITWRREGNDLITLPTGEEGELMAPRPQYQSVRVRIIIIRPSIRSIVLPLLRCGSILCWPNRPGGVVK